MKKINKQQFCSGFTLIELLTATSILGLTFSGLLSGLVFTSKSTCSLGNYSDMVRESTFFLETFAREVRMAEDVNAIGPSAFSMDVAFAGGPKTIEYEYRAASETLVRTENGVESIVMSDVDWVDFKYYNVLNVETNTLMEVKSVQMEAELEKRALDLVNTDHIISARFLMRNRTVSN